MKNSVNLAKVFGINQVLTAKRLGFSTYSVKNASASLIAETWDYKKDGLKVDAARDILTQICNQKSKMSRSRFSADPLTGGGVKRKIEHILGERNSKRRDFQKKLEKADNPNEYQTYVNQFGDTVKYTYGVWSSNPRDFKISESTIAKIDWTTESDWEYYSNSYGKPKNIYSDRCVKFRTFDRKTATYTYRTFELETFAGQFMEKALAWFMGIEKVKVSKELKSVQLNPIFSVSFIRSIGGVSVYSRSIGTILWDYCVVANGVNFHAATIEKAIIGLREKIEKTAKLEAQRIEDEGRVLNYEIARKKYGFCDTGIRNFCNLNGLEIESQYTIREIRKAVVSHRSENCTRFSSELKTIGIALNCN